MDVSVRLYENVCKVYCNARSVVVNKESGIIKIVTQDGETKTFEHYETVEILG